MGAQGLLQRPLQTEVIPTLTRPERPIWRAPNETTPFELDQRLGYPRLQGTGEAALLQGVGDLPLRHAALDATVNDYHPGILAERISNSLLHANVLNSGKHRDALVEVLKMILDALKPRLFVFAGHGFRFC
jgi:hypothetical protein